MARDEAGLVAVIRCGHLDGDDLTRQQGLSFVDVFVNWFLLLLASNICQTQGDTHCIKYNFVADGQRV